MEGSINHWENRYKKQGNSGEGSYGNEAQEKANYINNVINKYNIKSINDYGHGDGNQLTYIKGFKNYYGYDVSDTVREKCISDFKNKPNCNFISTPEEFNIADLAISLDVLYHVVEDNLYKNYLKTLFNIGNLILIYSVDKNSNVTHYFKSRKFTPYIKENFPNFELIETTIPNSKDVSMFLYKKIK